MIKPDKGRQNKQVKAQVFEAETLYAGPCCVSRFASFLEAEQTREGMAAERSAVAAPRAAGEPADPPAAPAAGSKRMRRWSEETSSRAGRGTCTPWHSGADPDAAAAPAGRGEPATPGGGRRQGASGGDGVGAKGDGAGRMGEEMARVKGLEHDNRRLKNNVMLLRLQVELLRQIVNMSHQAANWDDMTGRFSASFMDATGHSRCPGLAFAKVVSACA